MRSARASTLPRDVRRAVRILNSSSRRYMKRTNKLSIFKLAGTPEFVTDGCSGGITWAYRKLLGRDPPWEGCCEAHDTHYWHGGSWADRVRADLGLYECMVTRTTPLRAWFYFIGVRIGGGPRLFGVLPSPFSWRWNYRASWRESRYTNEAESWVST